MVNEDVRLFVNMKFPHLYSKSRLSNLIPHVSSKKKDIYKGLSDD